MSTILEQMLANPNLSIASDRKYMMREVMQEMVLCGLSRAGFFAEAAFYGGTALRIFYGLDRYSEDLDFSLMAGDESFDLTKYFPMLEKELASYGLRVEIQEKKKYIDTAVQSAFLKANAREHMILFYASADMTGIHPDEKIRIKFEVDTNPPPFASIEYRYRLLPAPYEVVLYDAPSLFAGKIHAVLCRAWKNRTKGRDLYDYIFFLSQSVPVNLKHLQARLIQSNYLKAQDTFTLSDLKEHLSTRFEKIHYDQAKEDVRPFIRNQAALSLWKEDFFKKITQQLNCKT